MKTVKPNAPIIKKVPPKSKPPIFKSEDYLHSGLNVKQITQFKEAFDLYDMQRLGRIDPKQLKNILNACNMQTKNKTFYQAIIALEKQGPMDFNKFLEIMSARSGLKKTRTNIKKLFQVYDYEKSGLIAQKNLKGLVKDLNLKISEQQINKMIQKANLNKDGVVSEEEFYLIMTKK